jgi:AAA15 family ATPase/GTPase
MLKSFSFSNFRMFKDEATIDFSTVDKHRSSKIITTGEFNKVIALYGRPSSGRSTILNVLHERPDGINFKADSDGEIKTFHLDDISVEQATLAYINDPKALKFTVGILKNSDLGVTNVVIDKNGSVRFEHGKFELPMKSESSGTIRLYCIMLGIYRAAKVKGVVLWDEHTILHPMLVRALISLFYDTESQLIISTNISLDWMTECFFDDSQIYMVDKVSGGSVVSRVDAMRERTLYNSSLCNNLFINKP